MRCTRILAVSVLLGFAMLLPSSSALARKGTRTVVCGLDRTWLFNDVQRSRYELAGVSIARQRSATPAVLQLAATIQRDDSRALVESAGGLREVGVKVPERMDPVQHWSLHMLSQQRDAAFDSDYAWLEVANHVVDIRDAGDEAQHGCNATVRSIAKNRLPFLRLHLRLASTWQTGPKS
jgi:predicted outer membrane protein